MTSYHLLRMGKTARRVLLGGVAAVAGITGAGCGQSPPVQQAQELEGLDRPTWRRTMGQALECDHLAQESLKQHDADRCKELEDRAATYYRIGSLQKQAAEFAAQGADESAARLLDETIRLQRSIAAREARYRASFCQVIKSWFAEHPTAPAAEPPCAKVQVQDSEK